jgi:DNA (cytosine-5)-methyltransferase 1
MLSALFGADRLFRSTPISPTNVLGALCSRAEAAPRVRFSGFRAGLSYRFTVAELSEGDGVTSRAGKRPWVTRLSGLDSARVLDRVSELVAAVASRKRARRTPNTAATRLLTRIGVLGARTGRAPATALADLGLSQKVERALGEYGSRFCRTKSPKCTRCVLISFCAKGIRKRRSTLSGLTAIDVFSGAGALSLGFAHEGFRIGVALEYDRNAAQTYRYNHPGVPVIEADIARFKPSHLSRWVPARPTVLIAGPPCQGYSAAGRRVPEELSNRHYRHVATIARSLQARLVVMENVPGLRSVNGVDFERPILRAFARSGYTVRCELVNASEYGVPQRRSRMIFFGGRQGLALVAPQLTPRDRRRRHTVASALRGLPALSSGQGQDATQCRGRPLFNHRAMKHSRPVIKKIAKTRPGTGPISYRRLSLDLATTIVAGHRALPVHPRQHRTITVREAARLQTLPDSFRILGPHHHQPTQVANVVPYRLARALARATRRAASQHGAPRHRA